MRKRTSFTRICRPPRMVPVLRFNPPQSGCFPASKFDTRENPKRGGLNCGGFSIGVVCPRSIDVDVRSAVSAPSRTATGIGNDLERSDPRHRTAIRAPKFAGYVRAPKTAGSARTHKGEPPLRMRGLPLAASSRPRPRVPLRPREAVEHPDTLGTVRDVGAPRGHDGPSRFEKIRALIGPRHLRSDDV